MVRYAICGLSNRGLASFVLPLIGATGGNDTVLGYGSNTEDFSEHGTLVAVVDSDRQRADEFVSRLLPMGYPKPTVHEDFDEMLATARPDAVIIASPDNTHEAYTIQALARGVDVIVEKPMTSTWPPAPGGCSTPKPRRTPRSGSPTTCGTRPSIARSRPC